MKDDPRLPESELDIMLVVWELKEATAPAILGKLYEGSLRRFAAALHDGGALDRSELEGKGEL